MKRRKGNPIGCEAWSKGTFKQKYLAKKDPTYRKAKKKWEGIHWCQNDGVLLNGRFEYGFY